MTPNAVALVVQKADLDYWLGEHLPVILVVYDASADVAYWLHVQDYFKKQSGFDLMLSGETVTVYLNTSDVVDREAIREFARIKSDVLLRFWKGANSAN